MQDKTLQRSFVQSVRETEVLPQEKKCKKIHHAGKAAPWSVMLMAVSAGSLCLGDLELKAKQMVELLELTWR